MPGEGDGGEVTSGRQQAVPVVADNNLLQHASTTTGSENNPEMLNLLPGPEHSLDRQKTTSHQAHDVSLSTQARGRREEAKHNSSCRSEKQESRKRSPRRGGKARMSANREEATYERKKHEQTYQKWQHFKEQQKDEKHAQLRRKLALQHELIRARDERHLQLVLQEERRLAEAREQQRAAKLEREAALVQHCKDELARKRQENLAKNIDDKPEAEDTVQDTEEQPVSSSAEPNVRTLSVIQSRDEDRPRVLPTLTDEDAEENEMASKEDDRRKEPALHKDLLYQMFGKKEADYFLYPRGEPQKTKKVRIPPSIRRHGGRAGADVLWSTLRDKSSVKLKHADALIPDELTAAYGAFVRECLTNNKTVASRSFYSQGIPENEQIQDKSYREKMRELRHHMALMYRAAQTNEDKTSILMFNNPMPDFSDKEGVEGPKRYWPSWMDQEEDEEEEPEYKKWLKNVPASWPQVAEELPSTPPELQEKWKKQQRGQIPEAEDDDANDLEHGSDAGSWEPMAEIPIEVHKEKPQKLTFLTEENAKCEGQFRKKFEKREGPKPYVPGTDVMKTAGLPVEEKPKAKTPGSSRQNTDSKVSQRRSHTAPASLSDKGGGDAGTRARQPHGSAPWQPLSMRALNDYKPATILFGDGDFAHGQEFMWKPVLAASTTTKP